MRVRRRKRPMVTRASKVPYAAAVRAATARYGPDAAPACYGRAVCPGAAARAVDPDWSPGPATLAIPFRIPMRLLLALLWLALSLGAQTSAPRAALQIPPGAEAGPGFDAEAAAKAYLATWKPDQKAR